MELYDFACELKALQERVWDLEEENKELKEKVKVFQDQAERLAEGSMKVSNAWIEALVNGSITVKEQDNKSI